MTKADFVWTVGYQGDTALVNKAMRQRFRNPEPSVLLDEGFLRAAFCAALWEETNAPGSVDAFVAAFGQRTGLRYGVEEIKRLLGVYRLPDAKVKVMAV